MDTCCNSMMRFQFSGPLPNGCGPSNRCPSIPNVDTAPAPKATPLPVDHFDEVLRYLNHMLMEEDRPYINQDSIALQAAEKSFYDALKGKDKDTFSSNSVSSPSNLSAQFSDQESTSSDFPKQSFELASWENLMESSWNLDQGKNKIESFIPPSTSFSSDLFETSRTQLVKKSLGNEDNGNGNVPNVGGRKVNRSRKDDKDDGNVGERSARQFASHIDDNLDDLADKYDNFHYEDNGNGNVPSVGGRKVNRSREDDKDDGNVEERSAKQFATHVDDNLDDLADKYDNLLLCPSGNPGFYVKSSYFDIDPTEGGRYSPPMILSNEPKRGRPRAGEKKLNMRQVVDLSCLLTQCADSVVSYDNWRANQLLNQIRQHSSPYGNANERLSHFFANALEARISGIGTSLYSSFNSKRVSAAETLKAYQAYFSSCPFQRMSNIFAGKSIGKVTREATKIHIIDFGIHYGFQWPCFIQGISLRPGGPPKLRITGIDLPQPGFRPAERVEETGHKLARYCQKFNVPFEYHAIAKKWETISLDDLKIDRSETIVVNSLYRLRHVPDETAEDNSQRDTVLNLINHIQPEIFIHGILNGSYNTPFFATRFREALFQFSSLFDMFEKTLPSEDKERLVLEKDLGRDSMNVLACEGSERIERPESYKQWQVRNKRAGFRQLPLIPEVVEEVRAKVKVQYHKDFLVDEDSNWILQGWKGRVLYAISCWKPNLLTRKESSRI